MPTKPRLRVCRFSHRHRNDSHDLIPFKTVRTESIFVMRIIAGEAKGMRLNVPRDGVRPTTDRTKAALFSWIGDAIVGSSTLDLFAGSGSLGIEALSRGAAKVAFVESHRPSVAAIERNVQASKTRQRAQIFTTKVESWIAMAARAPQPDKWDFILADPPWSKKPGDFDFIAWLLNSADLPLLLAPDGWLIVEAPAEKPPDIVPPWVLVDLRRYGKTMLCYLQAKGGCK